MVVWVADDGPGIRPDDLPHVFERHFTSDRVPSRQRRAPGLGLAIVAELVAAMGGGVRADSPIVDARGTRMTALVPRSKPRLMARPAAVAPSASSPAPARRDPT